jgi:hypothetical protein
MTNSDGDTSGMEALKNVTETTRALSQPQAAKLHILIIIN